MAEGARLREALCARFALDPRALRALRVGLGGLVLADLMSRAADLASFYTDQGLLPRAALIEPDATLPPMSLHLVAGSVGVVVVLFVLAALAALALAWGVFPRVSALLSWIFAVSIQHRNPALLSGGDQLLALLLLWCAFAPLDGRGASQVHVRGVRAPLLVSVGTAAIVAQVCAVHLFAGLIKLRESPAWRGGHAVGLALQDVSVSPWVASWLGHELLLAGVTWGVLALEIGAPLALLALPAGAARARTGVVLALLALHVGIALCLQVGIFPFVSIVALLALVPSWGWDRLRVSLPSPGVEVSPPVRWREGLGAALAALSLGSNVSSVWPAARPPASVATPLAWAVLAQEWSMYVDLREPSGWFRVDGLHASGEVTPLLLEGAPQGGGVRRHRNLRWHGYMGAMARRASLRQWMARQACRAQPFRRVEIHFECHHFCDERADVPPPPPREVIWCRGNPSVDSEERDP
ncbi:HTTM domain-containing protein [Chondromyces crocatus]|uniref:HTTM-like domain-containing protein n=1 Tax=Chondromyces crocatus TaxID=52 RepID=A0A0K1E5H4_CHOCO|nr:HTTM domain-containing protein [Chondromyces crocatus]AKT35947.1 uncharacterized protein CMC5_000590 [Chondromyces crocatus]